VAGVGAGAQGAAGGHALRQAGLLVDARAAAACRRPATQPAPLMPGPVCARARVCPCTPRRRLLPPVWAPPRQRGAAGVRRRTLAARRGAAGADARPGALRCVERPAGARACKSCSDEAAALCLLLHDVPLTDARAPLPRICLNTHTTHTRHTS
jgi:hypothetical protein